MLQLDLKLFIALSICLLAFPQPSEADVIVAKDTVTGLVIGKNKEPLPGAKVEIVGQPYSAFTDLEGRFNIKCDKGAKKVLVSYPKARDVKKKITPDMTVRIGRTWRQVPERYQWFFGASMGAGYTYNDIEYQSTNGSEIWYEEEFWSPTLSVMIGRVKAVGWYVKGFVNFPSKGHNCRITQWDYNEDLYYYSGDSIGSSGMKAMTWGAILGGMVRLGCPLHLCIGAGFGYSRLDRSPYAFQHMYYHRMSVQGDLGLLFRIKDHCGISLAMNVGATKRGDIGHGSFMNLGFEYFLDK